MSDDPKQFKVVFAPGSLEQMEAEMSPQEMQEIMDAIHEMIANGFEGSTPVDMDALERDDPEAYATLVERLESIDPEMETEAFSLELPSSKRTLH